ncbi:MAG: rubrerythrin family protein [Oscillospiraceae bacterium]|jgi:rubrerythrin|nr:rubrerythrin family protein [Oscillospiraceae bacterium]
MAKLKGSRTEANLQAAFASEAVARTKFDAYAGAAKTDGFEQIAAYFYETANNEKEHAEVWLKKLALLGQTPANLTAAVAEEHEELAVMYKEFAKVAEEEGFSDLAELFEKVGTIEKRHGKRYNALLANIEKGTVFKRDEETFWICRSCGHVHKGAEPPQTCPVCSYAQAFFELLVKDY